MRVSVIIPTLNRANDLDRCLHALVLQSEKVQEMIVIDNGSTDSTPDVLSQYDVRILSDPTRNLTSLFNRGWQEATGEVVAYLNDDSEPHQSWADWIIRAFIDFPDAAMVGGPTIDVNRRQIEHLLARGEKSRLIRFAATCYDKTVTKGRLMDIGLQFQTGGYSIGGYFDRALRVEIPLYVDQLTVTNVAIRRSALEALLPPTLPFRGIRRRLSNGPSYLHWALGHGRFRQNAAHAALYSAGHRGNNLWPPP